VTETPPWGDDTGRACGAAIIGGTSHLIKTDAVISNGPAVLRITGLPEHGSRENHDRIRAAIISAGLWPCRTITVTVLPAILPGHASSLDLAIAVAVLIAASAAPPASAEGCVLVAELGPDGSLRPVQGVLPAVLAAAAAGRTRAVVATENADEAATVPGVTVISCRSLQEVRTWLRGAPSEPRPTICTTCTGRPSRAAQGPAAPVHRS
jgi:magnesium chelatase family protein